ncbi:hypothetical protein LOOC260_101410 [Paucilactobacillus hokkaidonensis JCM 18461]|uniref:DUF7671 domain-containing protein n=2 Tax=Paucilactobacillus hokkaidonensis TaxID=1193095 RepID=A0A0A1GUM4_9LACO|nr:hypothetical protein [Paucilactobacillus hokkaidonensis]KRO09831.1 hypothetical protein IV59_GL000299 [Paucilactobacillus hokkaidonensis]BAP84719.1 hypothetical protein LOOC260_101410 [Paucilactobacillus hokkaidonensis JCM 18461]
MKNKYEVQRYIGLPVVSDNSGHYMFKADEQGNTKAHSWRTGKHTKGKFKQVGQLLLTENNLLVAIIHAEPMAFKDRHSEVPLQRFTTEFISAELLAQGQEIIAGK